MIFGNLRVIFGNRRKSSSELCILWKTSGNLWKSFGVILHACPGQTKINENCVFDISDKLICCSKVALGGKSCSRLLAAQKMLTTPKVANKLPSTIWGPSPGCQALNLFYDKTFTLPLPFLWQKRETVGTCLFEHLNPDSGLLSTMISFLSDARSDGRRAAENLRRKIFPSNWRAPMYPLSMTASSQKPIP